MIIKKILELLLILVSLLVIFKVINTLLSKPKAKSFPIPASKYKNWGEVLSNPSPIKISALKTGTIRAKLSGLINLKNSLARGLEEAKVEIPVLTYLITHEKHGSFLVDTGFDSSFSENSWGSYKGLYKKAYFNGRYFQENSEGIDVQLKNMGVELNGVYLTHFHEHIAGSKGLPNDIPFVFGKGEGEESFFPLVYSNFLKDKKNLLKIDFSKASVMSPFDSVVDIFGDGSFWALHTPGHSKGHISYLINGRQKTVLITGDVSPTKKGFDLGVECGSFSSDLAQNRESFMKIKEFADKHPHVEVTFGHECDEYPIQY